MLYHQSMLNLNLVAGLQGTRQINAHHRLVDGVVERFARGIHHLLDFESPVEGGLQPLQIAEVGSAVQGGLADFVAVAVQRADVLVQLNPNVAQLVRAVVGVGDGLGAVDALRLVVQTDFHVVVRLLLPVGVTRGTRCGAVHVGRGQFLSQLAEHVGVDALRSLLLRPSADSHQAAQGRCNPNSHVVCSMCGGRMTLPRLFRNGRYGDAFNCACLRSSSLLLRGLGTLPIHVHLCQGSCWSGPLPSARTASSRC